MQVYSSSLPFIHPRTSADLSHSQAMLHNLYGLGRTNILKHTLQPTEASLTLRLRSLWAHTYARSFSSLQEAKDYLHSKLIMIHPFAQKAYETEIAQIQTIEGIQNLAKRLFNLSDFATSKTVKPLFTEINKNLSQRSPEAATTRQNISKFWRTLISSKEPLETLHSIASEKLDTFPRELREQYAYILQERTIEEVKARAESHLKSLDTDIARLYPTEQERIIECLRSTWNFIKEYKDFSSREEVLDAMRSRLSAIQLPNIPTLYLQDAALSKTVESMQNRAERYLHDLESIKYPCNLTSTSSGATAYPKLINWERFEKITGFMKHLGVREEMDHNLVYNFFLSQPIQGFRFCVPKGAMFEFTSDPKYTSPFGKQKTLPPEEADYIKNLVTFMAMSNTTRSFSLDNELNFQTFVQTRPIGIFERVMGSNLLDFFTTSYQNLNDISKQNLFIRIGMIAYLDFILRNDDRFIRLDDVLSKKKTHLASNLGNLMISHDNTEFYAIDNGIGDGKNAPEDETKDPSSKATKQANDLAFLKKTLSTRDSEEILADYLLESLILELDQDEDLNQMLSLKESLSLTKQINSKIRKIRDHITHLKEQKEHTKRASKGRDKKCRLSALIDMWEKKLTDLKLERIKILAQDNTQVFASLLNGMQAMKDHLTHTMIPLWNSPESAPFKQTLNPEIVSTIQTRLNILNRAAAPSTKQFLQAAH